MRLQNRIKLSYLKYNTLFKLNRIEDSEYEAFLDIALFVLDNDNVGFLDEKRVVGIEAHTQDDGGVLIKLDHLDSNLLELNVGNYGADDYYYMDLVNAIHNTIGYSLNRDSWKQYTNRQLNYKWFGH